ncbi:hypothetical protein ACIUZB_30365 [Pseudomonas aeruginosa]
MRVLAKLMLASCLFIGLPAFALPPAIAPAAALEAASQSAIPGPAALRLNGRGILSLEEGSVFIPQPEAGKLLAALSGDAGAGVVGLVFSRDVAKPWFISIQWDDAVTFGLSNKSRDEPVSHSRGVGYPALAGSPFAEASRQVKQLQWMPRLDATEGEDGFEAPIGQFGLFGLALMGQPEDANTVEALSQLERTAGSIRYERTWTTAASDTARTAYSFFKNNRMLVLLAFGALGFFVFRRRAG